MTEIDVHAVPTGVAVRGEPLIELWVVAVGDIDVDAVGRLKNLLTALDSTPHDVVVDIRDARCTHLRLLRLLCEARTRRRRLDRAFRIHGLHEANVPDPVHLSLPDLFVVYDESRREPRPSPGARTAAA